MATTFHGKGVFPDDHPLALGAVGFMRHNYVNFGFDRADLIIAVGYELQEFDPARINPRGDTRIIHLHRFPAEVDAHYDVAVGLHSDIGRSLDALAEAVTPRVKPRPPRAGPSPAETASAPARRRTRPRSARRPLPLAPARIVADTRTALRREDIVLVDTGALKMWMARLYPTYEPNTCLISNGLSTMAWTVPGRSARKSPGRTPVLVATGDGAFLMNSQEIETALRLGLAFVILIWVDDAYGLISWKMDLEIGRKWTRGSPTRTSSPTRRASARPGTGSPRPASCSRRCGPPCRQHGLGDRLPGRLRCEPGADRIAWRPRRVAVLTVASVQDGVAPAALVQAP